MLTALPACSFMVYTPFKEQRANTRINKELNIWICSHRLHHNQHCQHLHSSTPTVRYALHTDHIAFYKAHDRFHELMRFRMIYIVPMFATDFSIEYERAHSIQFTSHILAISRCLYFNTYFTAKLTGKLTENIGKLKVKGTGGETLQKLLRVKWDGMNTIFAKRTPSASRWVYISPMSGTEMRSYGTSMIMDYDGNRCCIYFMANNLQSLPLYTMLCQSTLWVHSFYTLPLSLQLNDRSVDRQSGV